jgi:hypothetical protein
MYRDSVIDEIRTIRETYAEKFSYDLEAIYQDLKEKEKTCGHRLVSLPARRVKRTKMTKTGSAA